MNTELLEKVKAHILAEPCRLAMHLWREIGKPGTMLHGFPISEDLPREMPACGTVACIAGWTLELANSDAYGYGLPEAAAGLLEIERIEAASLFHVSNWPLFYRIRWLLSRTLRGRAKITAQRIDAFIRKHK